MDTSPFLEEKERVPEVAWELSFARAAFMLLQPSFKEVCRGLVTCLRSDSQELVKSGLNLTPDRAGTYHLYHLFPLTVSVMLDLGQDLVSRKIFPAQQSPNFRKDYSHVGMVSSFWLQRSWAHPVTKPYGGRKYGSLSPKEQGCVSHSQIPG